MNKAELLVVKDGSFGWMLYQIQKGQLVERQSWPWRHYLKLNQSNNVIHDCYFNDVECVEGEKYEPTSEDLIANDWVLSTNENKK